MTNAPHHEVITWAGSVMGVIQVGVCLGVENGPKLEATAV